ncbi:hypothetical protein BCL76_104269 [Streptomyces sp. CG 926]|uniref:hypothetical protein n=1 Tax=Streptomyces sp. CG 926 TaxID=1882405 RepID=UPI000D6BE195|nr:hypothetical protein [Streptomyces sp. CG 926]PWK71163.1 hypothetical protein BCL76_104269 [Streptomyces sp. CG 926]
MDSYDCTATLEWWANPSMCLGSFRVTLTVSMLSDGRRRIAAPRSPMSEPERERLDLLLRLDPVCSLRFEDDSTVLVHVNAEDADGRLVLSPCESAAP